jgi:tripartite-type tricarboxylate transporter receptor subunit TctC
LPGAKKADDRRGGPLGTGSQGVCRMIEIEEKARMIARSLRRHPIALQAALAFLAMSLQPAAAQSVADFYSGKSINVLIGTTTGGGYDLYARTLAHHMGRHIPGNPRILPQNMPGAGGLRAVNYLYSVAPKDGTAIGHFQPGIIFEPLLGRSREAGQFEAAKFTWIGSVSKDVSVCAFMVSTGIKTWRDMQAKPFIIAATGGGAESDVFPTILRNMFNLRLNLVTGYPGSAEINLAMERHEADGRCGWSWTSLLSRNKTMLDNKEVNLTLQIALERAAHPALKDVPLIVDLTDDPQKKAALALILARQVMARPFAAPPGVPPDRAQALREAFDATMKDPDYLAEMKQLDLDVDPVGGREIEELIRSVYASSPDVVKLAADSMKELKQ